MATRPNSSVIANLPAAARAPYFLMITTLAVLVSPAALLSVAERRFITGDLNPHRANRVKSPLDGTIGGVAQQCQTTPIDANATRPRAIWFVDRKYRMFGSVNEQSAKGQLFCCGLTACEK
jgi:hypothetical protein